MRYPDFLRPSSDYIANRFRPEPFEIPLYLLLSIIVTLLAFIYFYYRKKILNIFLINLKNSLMYKLIFLFALVAVFISKLSDYPLRESTVLPPGNFVLYISVLIVAISVFKSIDLFFQNSKKLITYGFALAVIVILTFTPRFPIGTNDYSAFFGPMIEAASGKTIYTEFNSQYGFFSVLFFGFLYKYGFNLMYVSVFAWIMYVFEYFSSFYILYKVTKSSIFSFLGLFSIITINYYSLIHIPMLNPQSNIFRVPQVMLAIALFLFFKNFKSKIFIMLIAFLSFWTVDTGIVLILGYSLTIFFQFLKRQIAFKEVIFTILYFLLNICCIYLLINLALITIGYKPINSVLIFEQIRNHGQLGFNMAAIPSKTFFWVFILIYFSCVFYFIKNTTDSVSAKLILFIANLSLFMDAYYVGRSIDHNLFHIAIFSLLNLFLLLGLLLKKNLNNFIVLLIIFITLVFIPAFNRQYATSGIIDKNLKNFTLGNIFEPEIDDKYLTNFYKDELTLVHKSIFEKALIILSQDDTYLFYLLKKKNLLNGNPQGEYFLKEDVAKAIDKAGKICPAKIITSCSMFNKSCSEDLLYFNYYYPLTMEDILLKELEGRCRFKYVKKECTRRLCIAEKE